MATCDINDKCPQPEEVDEDDDSTDSRDDDNEYYALEDLDVDEDKEQIEENLTEERLIARFHSGKGTDGAIKRLMQDFKALVSSKTKFGIEASPFENNIFVWEVKFTKISANTRLGDDLVQYAKKYRQEPEISLEMQFPTDYPYSPPFIRVLKPRFKHLTGHVTLGGSICMQMLTKSGWLPSNDIESILVQVRTEILSDPDTRLADHETNLPYTEADARKAFHRMVKKYGW